MSDPKPNAKLREFIQEEWESDLQGFATQYKLTCAMVYRLLRTGKTNNLRTAVTVQRATNGQILPEEWL
jgi:hypothetical protein